MAPSLLAQIEKMRIFEKPFLGLLIAAFAIGYVAAQNNEKQARPIVSTDVNVPRSTPAYAEVLLRETELKAEIESILLDYTEDYPKVKEIRFELESLSSEMDRLLALKPNEISKLTQALGKLILGKVSNQTQLRQLRLQYADEHPLVKRQRKKVEVYESAIKQILG